MDQSMVAGIGNIYRAEILFKVRILVHLPLGSCLAQYEADIGSDTQHRSALRRVGPAKQCNEGLGEAN